LELLAKFGANAWKLHNQQLESMSANFEHELESYKSKVVELNKLRKYEQTLAGAKLQDLELTWADRIQGVMALSMALHQLDNEIEQLESRDV
jgi:pre-mRNA-splicing factor SPF27